MPASPRFVVRLVLALTVASFATTIALEAEYPAHDNSFPAWRWISSIFVALVHAALLGVLARRRASRARAGVAAVGILLAWTLPLVTVAEVALRGRRLAIGHVPWCGGTGPHTLLGLDPVALLTLVLGIGFGALLLLRRGLDRMIAVLALAGIGLAPLAALYAFVTAGPTAQAYLESMPIVAELRAGSSVLVGDRTLSYSFQAPRLAPDESLTARNESTVPYVYPAPSCIVEGLGSPFAVGTHVEAHAAAARGESMSANLCPALRVRHDAAHDLAIVEQPDFSWALFAFHPSEGIVRSLDEGDLRGLAGPPRSFFVWPFVGAALAAMILVLAQRWHRADGAVARFDAAHVGEGRCKLDDRFVMIPAATGHPVGPVLLTGPNRSAAGYRDSAGAQFDTATLGTVAEHTRAANDGLASLRGLALVCVGFGLVPLGLAAIQGIH